MELGTYARMLHYAARSKVHFLQPINFIVQCPITTHVSFPKPLSRGYTVNHFSLTHSLNIFTCIQKNNPPLKNLREKIFAIENLKLFVGFPESLI